MTRTKIIITLLWLSALLLAGWTLSHLPLAEIVNNLGSLQLADCLLWGLVNIAIIVVLNYRWWIISNAVNASVNFWQLLFIRQAGQSISFITPGPQFGGEPLQLYWLWRRSKIPLHKALLALGLDRFFEFVINFSVLIFGVVLLLATPASATANWVNILGLLIIIPALLMLAGKLIIKQPQWLSQRITKISHQWQNHKYLISIKTQWDLLGNDFHRCLQQQKKCLFYAAFLSIAGWIGLIIEMLLMLWMANVDITLAGFLLLFVAMRLALLLPLPGGIGTLEAAIFWCFQHLNIPMESALVVIALMRLRDVTVLLFGLGCAGFLQRPQTVKTSQGLDSAS